MFDLYWARMVLPKSDVRAIFISYLFGMYPSAGRSSCATMMDEVLACLLGEVIVSGYFGELT